MDLEHEFGHIRQITERFGDQPLCTERILERPDGRMKYAYDKSRVLTTWQDQITEYHNRLIEFLRLHERDANLELLREHARGLREWRGNYLNKGLRKNRKGRIIKTRQQWVDEHFPDIRDLERQYRAVGGSELE